MYPLAKQKENTEGFYVRPFIKQTLPLMGIPIDIRLVIYEYIFATSFKTGLRPLVDLEPENQRPVSVFRSGKFDRMENLDILLTCPQLYIEASRIFYGQDYFHFSILRIAKPPYLHPWMQHISVGYTTFFLASLAKIDDVDSHIGQQIGKVMDCCPRLQIFSLHLLGSLSHKAMLDEILPNGPTAKALAILAKRVGKLAIITTGNKSIMEEVLLSIAPCEAWLTKTLKKWPVAITDDHLKTIRDREKKDKEHKIREFSLKREFCGDAR